MAEKVDSEGDTLASLFKTKFKRKVVRAICKQLRDIGNEALSYFEASTRPPKHPRQNYLTCAILKYEEIENENLEVITAAIEKLRSISEKNRTNFLLLGRLLVVKHHWLGEHAEERVFDHDGKIQKQLQDAGVAQPIATCNRRRSKSNLLELMKEDMTNQPYIICMYSYNIPCTDPEHMCSKIISEFATKHNEKVIVSYDDAFCTTSRTMATEIMIGNDNVITMNPQKCFTMPQVQGRRYGRSKRREFGCLFLDGSVRKDERKEKNNK